MNINRMCNGKKLAIARLVFCAIVSLLTIISNLYTDKECSVIVYSLKFLGNLYICFWVVCSIHEIFHAFFFRISNAEIKSMRVGVVLLKIENKKWRLILENKSFFSGSCTVIMRDNVGMIVALYAGGVSGILLAAFFVGAIFVCGVEPSIFDMAIILMGVGSGIYTLFWPYSADRRLIKSIKEKYNRR